MMAHQLHMWLHHGDVRILRIQPRFPVWWVSLLNDVWFSTTDWITFVESGSGTLEFHPDDEADDMYKFICVPVPIVYDDGDD